MAHVPEREDERLADFADFLERKRAFVELAVGDARRVEKAEVKKCKTKPPAPHTDASLLAAMEH